MIMINKIYNQICVAEICEESEWKKMKFEDLGFIDKYSCSDEMKKKIKEFYINKIKNGYEFTHYLMCTEEGLSLLEFEHFVGYRKNKNHFGQIKTWYEKFTEKEKYGYSLFGDSDDN